MPVLSATNIELSFGTRVILDKVSLSLEPAERIGIVGRNGGGKSTLMKILCGIMKPDDGVVQLARGARLGYLRQDPVFNAGETLRGEAESAFAELHRLHGELEKLFHEMETAEGEQLDRLLTKQIELDRQVEAAGGYAIDHKIDAVLHGLGFTDAQFKIPVESLSGGQKGRLALAIALLQEPDVLLLDEPTNHLDIDGRIWLEKFLRDEFKGAVILISHDRYLLDSVVHRIVEVEQARLIDYPGNYAAFVEIRAQRRLTQARAFENQQTKFKSEEAFIRRYRAGQRAKQAQGRLSKLERAKEQSTLERPLELETFRLELPKAPRTGDIVVSARAVSKAYDNAIDEENPSAKPSRKVLFHQLDFILGRGERWGIIGPNGAGKSTLVRCLLGEQQVDDGSVRLGSNVVAGYFRQTHEHIDQEKTVVQYLQDVIFKETGGQSFSEQQARNLAGAFLFSGDEQDRQLKGLSGGERSRAVLAGLLASAKNVMVLDEPTNHLDIPSAERLEDALAKPDEETGEDGYEGTIILISHDRALIDATCDHLLILDGKGNSEVFVGSWSEWYAKQQEKAKAAKQAEQAERDRKNAASKPAAKPAVAASQSDKSKPKGGKPAGAKHLAKFSTEQIELRMQELQLEIGHLDDQLADGDVWKDKVRATGLTDRRKKLSDQLAELEAEYLLRLEQA
jgi:ATP-binding cassette, subfamily F, member 3